MNSTLVSVIAAIALCLLSTGPAPCLAHSSTVKVGQYRILSLEDGLYLNAGPPHAERRRPPNSNSESNNLGLELGDAATEKWDNFREQRWDLVPAPEPLPPEVKITPTRHGQLYWLLSQENLLNRVSAIKSHGRAKPNVVELIPIGTPDGEAALIKSSVRDACLVNPGYGLNVLYALCDHRARNQHWVLDFLGK